VSTSVLVAGLAKAKGGEPLGDELDSWSDEDEIVEIVPILERLEQDRPKPAAVQDLIDEAVQVDAIPEVVQDLVAAAGPLYPFSPQVRLNDGDGRVAIWLPELAVFSEGDSFDEAAWDLVQEVLQYVSDWETRLGDAPNHADKAGWVLRVQMNRSPQSVYRLLFGGAPAN
jgi:hypothetical protein